MSGRRTICWFSCGAASAVATKLTLADDPHALVVRVDTGSEHEDSERFMADCEEWFGKKVTVIRSQRYRDVWQVWEERRFLVGPEGALCTGEMKKKPRFAFEIPTDLHVFGYCASGRDPKRARNFEIQNPGMDLRFPLLDADLSKQDCYSMVARAGIELPVMYRLGYENNNCIGCPKGGMGYWNKIRVDFPDVFDRMAKLERDIGHSVLSEEIPGTDRQQRPVWLDELDPDRGDYGSEPDMSCSLNCAVAEVAIQ